MHFLLVANPYLTLVKNLTLAENLNHWTKGISQENMDMGEKQNKNLTKKGCQTSVRTNTVSELYYA